MFADLFSERGRRSVPPSVVATLMVLQRREGLSDREAVEGDLGSRRLVCPLRPAVLDLPLQRRRDHRRRSSWRISAPRTPLE